MEKLGVVTTKVLTEEETKLTEKTSSTTTKCSHPATSIITEDGITFCKDCESYITHD